MEVKGRNNIIDAVHKNSTSACEDTTKTETVETSLGLYKHE